VKGNRILLATSIISSSKEERKSNLTKRGEELERTLLSGDLPRDSREERPSRWKITSWVLLEGRIVVSGRSQFIYPWGNTSPSGSGTFPGILAKCTAKCLLLTMADGNGGERTDPRRWTRGQLFSHRILSKRGGGRRWGRKGKG